MIAKPHYDRKGNRIPLILTDNRYGYRVNVVDHPDGRAAYEAYRKERGHSLAYPESDAFRLAFEREYIAKLYQDIPQERRPAILKEAYAQTST